MAMSLALRRNVAGSVPQWLQAGGAGDGRHDGGARSHQGEVTSPGRMSWRTATASSAAGTAGRAGRRQALTQWLRALP